MRLTGVAIGTLFLAAGCGATGGRLPAAAGPPQSNQKVLTHAQSQRLVDWATALHSCLEDSSYRTGSPVPAKTRIEMSVPDGTEFRKLLQAAVACGESLGDPPKGSSLQTFPTRIVLYLPKQCLLDPRTDV